VLSDPLSNESVYIENKDRIREKNREKREEKQVGIMVSRETAAKARRAVNLRGFLQWQLAQLIGICESYLSKILRGDIYAEPEPLAGLCKHLHLDPEDFCQSCPLHQLKQKLLEYEPKRAA